MSIRIPILIEGHDGGACFWIRPVKCLSTICFDWDKVEENSAAEVSLDEETVFAFLKFFFYKYFDNTLVYNQHRENGWDNGQFAEFDWNLTHNFYTRKAFRQMLLEIRAVAEQIKAYGLSAVSNEITKNYWLSDDEQPLMSREEHKLLAESHVSIIVGFYQQFVVRMTRMLDENPDWPLISIMGP